MGTRDAGRRAGDTSKGALDRTKVAAKRLTRKASRGAHPGTISGRRLARRGAAVSILFIPPSPTGEKQGADDYLVAYGAARLREMLP